MKKRYTDEQIIKAIKEHEYGAKVQNISRDLCISNGTFYNWRSRFSGLEVNEAKRLLADKLFEVEAITDVLAKKW